MLSLQDDIPPVTTVVVAVGVAVVEVSGEVADGSLSVGRLESTGGRRANECSDDGSDTEPAGGGGMWQKDSGNCAPPCPTGIQRQLYIRGCLSRLSLKRELRNSVHAPALC